MTKDPFKACPSCGHPWTTRDALISDPEVTFAGYQAWVEDGVLGLFLFNHLTCETTMALSARHFEDLVGRRAIYEPSGQHKGEPSPHCLSAPSSGPCPETCECAWVQEVVDRLAKRE